MQLVIISGNPLFDPGQVVATPGALEACKAKPAFQ